MNKESLMVFMSTALILISSIAQGIGIFCSSIILDKWGFNATYISGGIVVFISSIIYAAICGTKNSIEPIHNENYT